MSDLIRVDAWLHNVFNAEISLEGCEKCFREFSLEGDIFILKEIENNMIPFADNNGYPDIVTSYKRIIEILGQCIVNKLEYIQTGSEKGWAMEKDIYAQCPICKYYMSLDPLESDICFCKNMYKDNGMGRFGAKTEDKTIRLFRKAECNNENC